jgi:hypothetical protein
MPKTNTIYDHSGGLRAAVERPVIYQLKGRQIGDDLGQGKGRVVPCASLGALDLDGY